MAKVESPCGLIEAIGSIWTATRRLISHKTTSNDGADDVTRPGEGRKENHVEAQAAGILLGVAGEPDLGGPQDAAAVDGGQRFGLLVREAAHLDLDEHRQVTTLGDEVDLAGRRLHPPRYDAEALEPQEQRRPGLAAAPSALGAPLELERASPARCGRGRHR